MSERVHIAVAEPNKASRSRRLLRSLAWGLLVLIVLWVAAGYAATIPVVGNHPYWRTLRSEPADFGLQAENVSFFSRDHIRLTAWYIAASGTPRGSVILAHGIDGNRSDMLPRAAFLVRAGYNALVIDLRDHGQSGGNYASPGYRESLDVLGALDYLKARGAQRPFIAMGHSYGAVAVLWSAAQSPDISAAIADSAYISFADMVHRATLLLAQDPARSFGEQLGLRVAGSPGVAEIVGPVYWLRTGVWVNQRVDTLRPIARIGDRPLMFIAGADDMICPPRNARVMFQAARSPHKVLLIVPSADHDSTYRADPKLYADQVTHFLGAVSR